MNIPRGLATRRTDLCFLRLLARKLDRPTSDCIKMRVACSQRCKSLLQRRDGQSGREEARQRTSNLAILERHVHQAVGVRGVHLFSRWCSIKKHGGRHLSVLRMWFGAITRVAPLILAFKFARRFGDLNCHTSSDLISAPLSRLYTTYVKKFYRLKTYDSTYPARFIETIFAGRYPAHPAELPLWTRGLQRGRPPLWKPPPGGRAPAPGHPEQSHFSAQRAHWSR